MLVHLEFWAFDFVGVGLAPEGYGELSVWCSSRGDSSFRSFDAFRAESCCHGQRVGAVLLELHTPAVSYFASSISEYSSRLVCRVSAKDFLSTFTLLHP